MSEQPAPPTSAAPPASAKRCFVAGTVILVVYNVARGLGAFGDYSGVAALGLLAVFAFVARGCRLTAAELGLASADARRGAVYGLAALLAVTAVLTVVALVPATNGFLEDERADVSGLRLLFEIAVPILLLTAIPEEFVFRGVLQAAGARLWGGRTAALVTSALFGIWHISPTLQTATGNAQVADTTSSVAGTLVVVAGAVVATFAGGLLFAWLRLRSGSLVAPVIAHLATNGVALAVAWTVVR